MHPKAKRSSGVSTVHWTCRSCEMQCPLSLKFPCSAAPEVSYGPRTKHQLRGVLHRSSRCRRWPLRALSVPSPDHSPICPGEAQEARTGPSPCSTSISATAAIKLATDKRKCKSHVVHVRLLVFAVEIKRVNFSYPKLASIWKGGCAANKLLYSPPWKDTSWSGSTKVIKRLTIRYACSLLWSRAQRAIFHVVDHPGPSSPEPITKKLENHPTILLAASQHKSSKLKTTSDSHLIWVYERCSREVVLAW